MRLNILNLTAGLESLAPAPYSVAFIAELAHEHVRSYNALVGDEQTVAWADAPEWQRESAIDGVLFYLKNPTATAEQVHENWLATKREEGWSCGELKDPVAKTHPCMVPYAELSLQHKLKDHLFMYTVNAFIECFNEEQITELSTAEQSGNDWYGQTDPTSDDLSAGTEGVGDFFMKLLGLKQKTEEKKPTKAEESAFEWANKNIDGQKLKAGLVPKDSDFKVKASVGGLLTTDGKAVKTVAEFTSALERDLKAYSSVFNTYKSDCAKAESAISTLSRKMDSTSDYDGLRAAIMSMKGKLPQSIAARLKTNKTEFLGGYGGFVDASGAIDAYKNPTSVEVTLQPASLEEFNKLLAVQESLTNLWLKFNSLYEDYSQGLDATDPPLRQYTLNELNDDSEAMEALNPYLHPTYDDDYGLVALLEHRTWDLVDAVIEVVRAGVTTSKGN